jgi:hypothetical protein
MASASYRLRSDPPADRWSNETSVDAEMHPVDLDQQNDARASRLRTSGKRRSRALVRWPITFCVGVAATLAWQSYGDVARETVASSYPQLAWLAPQDASPVQTAADAAAPEPAAPAPDPQELKAMLLEFAAVRQSVDRLAAALSAGNQQMAGDIASLQAAQQAILRKISAPAPRPPAAPPHSAAPPPSAMPPPPSLSSVAPPAR